MIPQLPRAAYATEPHFSCYYAVLRSSNSGVGRKGRPCGLLQELVSVAVVVVAILPCLGLGAWPLAPRLAGQLDQLIHQIPQYECSIVQMESQADRFDLSVVKLPVR